MEMLGMWHMYVVPAPEKQKLEDKEFEANLGYIIKPYPIKQQTKQQHIK